MKQETIYYFQGNKLHGKEMLKWLQKETKSKTASASVTGVNPEYVYWSVGKRILHSAINPRRCDGKISLIKSFGQEITWEDVQAKIKSAKKTKAKTQPKSTQKVAQKAVKKVTKTPADKLVAKPENKPTVKSKHKSASKPVNIPTNIFQPFQQVLVRTAGMMQDWKAGLYSHCVITLAGQTKHCVSGEYWDECIPYKGNERLLQDLTFYEHPAVLSDKISGAWVDSYENVIEEGDDVLVRTDDTWTKTILRKVTTTKSKPHRLLYNYRWKQCLKYKGNEHLEGSAKEPKIK